MKKKIVVIIQARMGSTRLPGKVMKKICDKTILEHVVSRVSRSQIIDSIVIATTNESSDEIIVTEANRLQKKIFRGSEKNVLQRYYLAAVENNADIIVRVTSDCPLYDWHILDNMINYYLNKDCDYLSNGLIKTYPLGLATEIFSFNAFKKAYFEAKLEYELEHVTPYIWKNPEIFKIENYAAELNNSHHRWTLDNPEDLILIEAIYNNLYHDNNYFTTDDILNLFKNNPNLFYINSHIEQKVI